MSKEEEFINEEGIGILENILSEESFDNFLEKELMNYDVPEDSDISVIAGMLKNLLTIKQEEKV